MKKYIKLLYVISLLAFSVSNVFGFQEDKKPDTLKATKNDTKKKKGDDKKKDEPKFKKYEEVITKEAITKKGVFTTHEVGEKLYYEFDPKDFGKEFLWLVQLSKVETGFGLGGTEVNRRLVKFERLGDYVLLRNVSYAIRADKGSSEDIAVSASSLDGIIASIKIVTFGPKKTPVVEMTKIFKGDLPQLSPKLSINAAAVERDRIFITSVKTFERNIETRVLASFRRNPRKPGRRQAPGSHVTVELHHSMVALPEKPMRPRYSDPRVGYFDGTYTNYSSDQNIAEKVKLIKRWRLEKKDPSAAISEPVKPIVFYVGRGVPEKWRKYTIEGIEMWQSAFEAAGFKNAIIGKLAPTAKENPDWDAENTRYSTIRWLTSEIRNAYGPNVSDPRTGEIIEADIRIFHNVMALVQDWFFVQAGATDPRAAKLPLPDEVVGELLRYVVAHEVGHSLGLMHNFIASNSYSVESYRDLAFVKKFGVAASIMDYARFNYIAQPGDGAAHITDRVGPYDHFAIEWGYREFDNKAPVKGDSSHLHKIAARQLNDPRLRFALGGNDPRSQAEDLGNDAIKATAYGIKNLERIAGNLVSATSENGKDFSRLKAMYGELILQLNRELNHVSTYVGGVETDNLVHGLPRSDTFRPIKIEKQKEALKFLIENAFYTKDFLLRKDIIERIGVREATAKISAYQFGIVRRIYAFWVVDEINRMKAFGYEVYSPLEIFAEVRKGVFSEIYEKDKTPDMFRRKLQSSTVKHLITSIEKKARGSDDFKALCRETLITLRNDLNRAAKKEKDGMSRIHYRSLAEAITLGLQGK